MIQVEMTAGTLIDVLLDAQRRSALFKAIEAEQGTQLPLTNKYEELASRCQATSDQIRQVVYALLEAKVEEWLIEPFIFHPEISDDLLFELYDRGCCLVALAHRPGPKDLLEKLANEHHHGEAITTLALSYYGANEGDDQEFAEFIRRHKDDHMLRYNLRRSPKLSEAKRAIALALIE